MTSDKKATYMYTHTHRQHPKKGKETRSMRIGLQYQDHIWHTQIIKTITDQLS